MNRNSHQFVISSKPNINMNRNIIGKVLNNDLAILIINLAFPHFERCYCRHDYTCYLCVHACCKLAHRGFCMCKVKTVCSKHGVKCIGNHD
jgi:hypothetical protein